MEIKPTKKQIQKINQSISICRWLYNEYISVNNQLYAQFKKGFIDKKQAFMSANDFDKHINNEVKVLESYSWINNCGSKARKKAIQNAETAYKKFFKGQSKLPRFKKKNKSDVKLYFPKNNKGDWKVDRHRIMIPTLKNVRLKEYGYIPAGAKVISGTVSLYKLNENGQKKVIFILGEGKVVNEVIIKELPASINCRAFEDAELLKINKNKLLEIMKYDFELCKNIIISLSMKTRRMYRQLKNTPPSIKIEKKLAAKIYKLGRDYGVETEEGIVIKMNLTVTYLADLLGSQRETVSRALKILQDKKLISYKDKIILIYDLNKISEFFKTS